MDSELENRLTRIEDMLVQLIRTSATKAGLAELESKTKSSIDQLRDETKSSIDQLRNELRDDLHSYQSKTDEKLDQIAGRVENIQNELSALKLSTTSLERKVALMAKEFAVQHQYLNLRVADVEKHVATIFKEELPLKWE